jgi:hypothetical protein
MNKKLVDMGSGGRFGARRRPGTGGGAIKIGLMAPLTGSWASEGQG